MSARYYKIKYKKTKSPILSEINITPLVDVMLVLLVVFMVTAPLMIAGVNVDLPQTNASPVKSQEEPLSVTIDKKGQIYIQNKLVLLKVEVLNLENLRWEKSQTKDLFPHLYSILKLKNIKNVFKIILNSDGIHKLPPNL